MNLNQNIFLACACLFSTVIVGCSSSEGTSASFDVSIYPSKDLAKVYGYYPSFEVDILGAGNEDTIKLGTYLTLSHRDLEGIGFFTFSRIIASLLINYRDLNIPVCVDVYSDEKGFVYSCKNLME